MRILVIGGTQFVGRAFVEEAVGRGHDLTIFHRGEVEPDDFPVVEHVHGDRHRDLALLAQRAWDATLDTHAYFPSDVQEVAGALDDAVGHYTLISTLAVHPDEAGLALNEASPTHEPLFGEAELGGETYGPLKAACEIEASDAFEHCLTIRPGYLVGPHDPTDRFTSYVRRAAEGGEMAAPGPPDAPFQMLDVRDLATFVLDRIEGLESNLYGVAGPTETNGMQDTLATARDVADAKTTFAWLPEKVLQDFGEEASRWFPMWQPNSGFHTYDSSKALRAGLKVRPLAATVADTLAWDDERGRPELRFGLPRARERELLGLAS